MYDYVVSGRCSLIGLYRSLAAYYFYDIGQSVREKFKVDGGTILCAV